MKLKKHMSVLLSILLSLSGNSIFALDGDGIVDNNNGESAPKFKSEKKIWILEHQKIRQM